MNEFYSSLVVNTRKFPSVHQVFKPRYNRIYFKRVGDKIELLESHLNQRCKDAHLKYDRDTLNKFKANHRQLVKLNETYESLSKKVNDENRESKQKEIDAITSQIHELEELVMPLTVSIPNRTSKQTPEEDVVKDKLESSFLESQNLFKVLSHTKLSYINNCYSKSVVGPNSYYYRGIGAKLQQGLADYFESKLSREGKLFAPVSGTCLVKSAVVEACNARSSKDFARDPCRVLTDQPAYTTLHLVEASRESMVGFLTTLLPSASNEPIRLVARGAGYRIGSNWFDADTKRISQFETLHALTLCNSIESYSVQEYARIVDLIWNSYKALELPLRLVHCSIQSMREDEYDAHRIDVWLPSLASWLEVGRVSHHLDFITVRCGMKRGHIVDSMVFCGQTLTAAILENRQTSLGKFIIPTVIYKHMPYLTDSEKNDYFMKPKGNNQSVSFDPNSNVLSAKLLNNYEQRRYLVKKNYVFGHSKKAEAHITSAGLRSNLFLCCMGVLIYVLFDWVEVFRTYLPKGVQRLLYDNIYRPYRRLRNWLLFRNNPRILEQRKLEDLPYDQEPVFHDGKDFLTRRKEHYFATQKNFDDQVKKRD